MRPYALATLGIVLCLQPLVSLASTYENTAFSYRVAGAAGWETKSGSRANPAVFVHKGAGIQAKIQTVMKDEAITPAATGAIRSTDEKNLQKKYAASKSVEVRGVPIDGLQTMHYGFLFRAEKGPVQLVRFSVASIQRPEGHLWVRFQAVHAKDASPAASDAVDALLGAIRLKALPSADPTPSEVVVATPPPVAVATPNRTPVAATAQPAPDQGTDHSSYYDQYTTTMNAEEAKQLDQSFQGNGGKRSAEEEARARARSVGSVFGTSDN